MAIFSKKELLSRVYRKLLHKFFINDIWLDIR
jgi:hypothetical protein